MNVRYISSAWVAASVLAGTLGLSLPALAADAASRPVAVWPWADGGRLPAKSRSFEPFVPQGEIRFGAGAIAVGDLGHDGISEIVVGSGFGAAPKVRVLRADGSEIFSFAPFPAEMLHGVSVAIGDLDGDGKAEIAAASGPGGDTRVRVFDNMGKQLLGFAPYADDFRGGANLAIADVDGDGRDELVTAPGPTGGPQVKIWNAQGLLVGTFFAFENAESVGLNLAAGDLDGDGKAEIVTALSRDREPYVRVFSSFAGTKTGEFLAISKDFRGGLNLAVADLDGDGTNEIAVAPNGGGGPHVHAYRRIAVATGSGSDYALYGHFFPYDKAYQGGVLLAAGAFGAPTGTPGERRAQSLVTVPAERSADGRPHLAKYINVDISDQRMRVYEYGKLVNTLLVTTGKRGFDTPEGDFSILAKPLMVNYKWNYGAGNPENYDLGWVKWNLRFYPHIYIHNAPWRSTFGVRGSHGCVNVSPKNAEWIYGWSDVGTPITVQK